VELYLVELGRFIDLLSALLSLWSWAFRYTWCMFHALCWWSLSPCFCLNLILVWFLFCWFRFMVALSYDRGRLISYGSFAYWFVISFFVLDLYLCFALSLLLLDKTSTTTFIATLLSPLNDNVHCNFTITTQR